MFPSIPAQRSVSNALPYQCHRSRYSSTSRRRSFTHLICQAEDITTIDRCFGTSALLDALAITLNDKNSVFALPLSFNYYTTQRYLATRPKIHHRRWRRIRSSIAVGGFRATFDGGNVLRQPSMHDEDQPKTSPS